MTRKGVVGTAELARAPVDLTGGVAPAALEHHVLEEVGDAGLGGLLVTRPGPVPEGGGDQRRLPVEQQTTCKAVLEPFQAKVARHLAEGRQLL